MNSRVEFELCEDRVAYGRGVICPVLRVSWLLLVLDCLIQSEPHTGPDKYM